MALLSFSVSELFLLYLEVRYIQGRLENEKKREVTLITTFHYKVSIPANTGFYSQIFSLLRRK